MRAVCAECSLCVSVTSCRYAAVDLQRSTLSGRIAADTLFVADMVATQVSSVLSAPRFFQAKPVKPSKVSQVAGPLYRPVARPHNFAFNPAIEASDLASPRAFIRPDCPPDASEQAPSKQLVTSQGGSAKKVNNSARSALEQVS